MFFTRAKIANKLSRCLKWGGATALTLSVLTTGNASATDFADFLFVVDESGSMSTEHDWLGDMIGDLETGLQSKGLGDGAEANRYGLVGFGGRSNSPRSLDLNSSTTETDLFGSADQFKTATGDLVTDGFTEDGYDGINFGLSNYNFRPGAAVNVVLVTDEDRDVANTALDFDSILQELNVKGALLNAVVNYSLPEVNGSPVLGADATGRAFVADGNGDFQFAPYTHVPGSGTITPIPGTGDGPKTTEADYTNLAWATQNGNLTGATWDLNKLREGGLTASSFTRAFVDIKTEEAAQHIPEPSLLLGLGCLGLALVKTTSKQETAEAEAS